jgi:hypothetical protein
MYKNIPYAKYKIYILFLTMFVFTWANSFIGPVEIIYLPKLISNPNILLLDYCN